MGITGYVLALALVIPIAGWLVNQFNGKYVFIGASILFGITSVLAGISWNAEFYCVQNNSGNVCGHNYNVNVHAID